MIGFAPSYNGMPGALAARIQAMIPALQQAGVGFVLFMPFTQTQYGYLSSSIGYDTVRHLDVGQWQGAPTRNGTAQELFNCCTSLQKSGIAVGEDVVRHQMDGNVNGWYFERGADGKVDETLFPKGPGCFVKTPGFTAQQNAGKVNQDPVFTTDPAALQAYGDKLSYVNSLPKNYMRDGMVQAALWRGKAFGVWFRRHDDGKDANPGIVKHFVDNMNGPVVIEYDDGNVNNLANCVAQTGGLVEDFPFHYVLKGICDGGVSFKSVPGNGFYDRDSNNTCVYVDNHDSDGDPNQAIISNKEKFAYPLMLTVPTRFAMIFGKDWLVYGLSKVISNIAWISYTFAFGKLLWLYETDNFLVWARDGDGGSTGWSGGLVMAMARGRQGAWIDMSKVFGPNVHIHDYSGNGPDLWTNSDGWAYVTANEGFVAYARAGVNRPVPVVPRPERGTGNFTDFSSINVKYPIAA
jgi:hypothetical protein